MTTREAERAFLTEEIAALAAFDCLIVAPAQRPLESIEVVRREDGGLEVRMPPRPPPFPGLSPEESKALEEMGFSVEEVEHAPSALVHAVSDEAAAIDLLQKVRVEVFGAKPDVRVDIAHGSHRLEHEARQKLIIARERIEPILEQLVEKPIERDPDGDYLLPVGQVQVTVAPRAGFDGSVVTRVFAVTNVGITVTPELGLFLARLNFGLMFGRFSLDVEHRSIWFDESLLGEQFREEELRFAVKTVASTADAWDDRLKQMFGGVTYQEVLAGKAAQARPAIKPGEGVGMYL